MSVLIMLMMIITSAFLVLQVSLRYNTANKELERSAQKLKAAIHHLKQAGTSGFRIC